MRASLVALRLEAILVFKEIAASLAWRRAALVLLPYIGVLIGLDTAAHYGEVTDAHLPAQFFLSQDYGFGEYLEYALTGSVAVMLYILWMRSRSLAYLTNAALFAWLTADNSIQLHEAFGHWVAPRLQLPPGSPVNANDIGEVMVFAMVGLMWVVSLWTTLRDEKSRPAIHMIILAACVAAAAFFGVIVDLAVVWGEHTLQTKELETWLEDGGEFAMICATFFVALAIFDTERRRWGASRTQAHQQILT